MAADSWVSLHPITVERHSTPDPSVADRSRLRISAVPLPTLVPRERSLAIDALRGLVIALMILDHTRDFFFGMRIRATDLSVTTEALFFTRWVTHFCAPVFIFLAGASAFMYGARHTPRELTRFLLTRGALLIALELTVVRMCWIPDPFYRMTLLQVIWATGWSMLLLAAVARLSPLTVLVLAMELTLAQTQLAPLDVSSFGSFGWLFQLLHQRGTLHTPDGRTFMVTYPIMPWFAVMLFGYAFGSWSQLTAANRSRRTLQLGLVLCASFVLLRAFTLIGDPEPFAIQDTWQRSVMAFLNCEKYPPSLCYLLMTLGPALCLLALWERKRSDDPPRYQKLLAIYGGVPLFCYVVHLAVLRYLSIPLAYQRFGKAAFAPPPGHAGSPEYPLWATYLIWLAALALLLPAARWFRAKKRRAPDSILRYF